MWISNYWNNNSRYNRWKKNLKKIEKKSSKEKKKDIFKPDKKIKKSKKQKKSDKKLGKKLEKNSNASLAIPKLEKIKKKNASLMVPRLENAKKSKTVVSKLDKSKKKNKKGPGNPSKKFKRFVDKSISLENTNINSSNSKSFSKLKLKIKDNNSYENSKSIKKNKKNNIQEFKNKIKKINMLDFNDFELNSMKYILALEIDKRTYFEYYLSLLKTKHPISFSFFPVEDYNIKIIKICLFLLSFSLYYSFNTIFFDFTIIHEIYEKNGSYDFLSFLPIILYSFIITYIIIIFIKFFILPERDILKIKNETIIKIANKKAPGIQRCIIIKNISYLIISIILLIFFWYYLSSFGAVYQNSQVHLIKNTFISFAISLLFPLFINLIPGIFRSLSLNAKNREFIYKISQIIQLF